MEGDNSSRKRKQAEVDSSDSESEITFNNIPEKKKPKRDNMSTPPDFVAQIKEHFDKKTDEIALRFEKKIEPLEKKLEEHSDNIASINEAIKRLESNSSSIVPLGNANVPGQRLKEEKYWESRRSARMWSIVGATEQQMTEATIKFCHTILLVPEDEKVRERIKSVRRTRTAFKSKLKDEVLVTFESVASRDFIFGHAKNLSKVPVGQRDTYGMRIDYPAHLGSDYRALDSYGASLRTKFGSGFRRNIKFDDDELALYMDICLPRTEEWIRVSAGLAKEEKKTYASYNEEETRKKINNGLREAEKNVLTGGNATNLISGANAGLDDLLREMQEKNK